MHKYLFIGILCMGMGGHFTATAAAVKPVKKPLQTKVAGKPQDVQNDKNERISNIPTAKFEKFLTWYETSASAGKQLPESVSKAYDKVKNHIAPKRKPLTKKTNSPHAQAFHRQHESKKSHKHHHDGVCLKKYVLNCSHFGKKGVVITRPGYYCLSENVAYKPHYDNVPAITIASDDVILDLSTHVLSQCPKTFDAFDNTTAIVVESGYNFVTIKNGRIHNFSNNGVIVKSDNLSPDDHHGIVIEHIIVNDCGKITTASDLQPFNARSGIGVYGTTDCVIQDCETSGITSLLDTEAISTFFTDNLLIKNCLSHSNSSDPDTGFTEGIEVNFFNNAIIEGCASIKNTGSQALGIIPVFGTSLVLKDCQGNENVSNFPTIERSFSVGIAIYFVDGGVLTNSQGNFNVAQSENLDLRKFCTGIQVAQSNIEVNNCAANFNLATSDTGLSGGACVGFDINSVSSCILKNCSAEGNSNYSIDQNGGGGGSIGFDCDNASNVLFEDCVAIANNAQPGGTPTKVGGFYASIFPEGGYFANIVYKNCTSLNHSCDFEGTTVAGFLVGENPPTTIVVNPNQIIIDGCIAEGNVNTSNPGIGAGVSFENGTTSSSVLNCILKGNGVGILVRGANTVSNLFENNEITANAVYGIEDA
ncbi:MAG: right-handed parallel beta-helix repeat-containing protein, partial [Chlamydiales bacterium]|nr:right-handed parallel beta-helix repeat-containing protein [Chlamydiales bacterium]